MVRETSIESYNHLKESNKLSEKRWVVYDGLFQHGPATGMELLDRMRLKSGVDSQVRARLFELREMGLVKEDGLKVCSVTGMRVILWDVTDEKIPKTIPKSTVSSGILKEREACALIAEKWSEIAATEIRNRA